MSHAWDEAEEQVDRAHAHFEAGRWDEAETLLRRALEVQPQRVDWRFNLGLTQESCGKHAAAAATFRACAELEPDQPQHHLAWGENLLRAHRPADALPPLLKARDLDPDRLSAYVALIEAHSRTGGHEDAEVAFYRGLQTDDNHAPLFANMAEALMHAGRFDRAEGCLRRSLELNPLIPGVLPRLAECARRLGRPDEARRLYLKALREQPGDAETLLDFADLLADMGRSGDASEKYRRVLELEPGHPDAHAGLGMLAFRQRRFDACVRHLRPVIKANPERLDVRVWLASALMEQGATARAAALAERGASRLLKSGLPEGIDDHAVRDLARLLSETGHDRLAARVLLTVWRSNPNDAALAHEIGSAALRCGRLRLGVSAERRAVALDPRLAEAWHNLALAYINRGGWERAWLCVSRGLALRPGDPNFRRLRALYLVRRLKAALRRLSMRRRPAPESLAAAP